MDNESIDPPAVTIDAGDAVRWVNDCNCSNYVQGYWGGWATPSITNVGASVSRTFEEPGFFLYRTAYSTVAPVVSGVIRTLGCVTVRGCTSNPPAVTINSPIDGFRFGGERQIQIDATVHLAATNIAEVDIFANATLLGRLPGSPPYQFLWTGGGTNGYIASGWYWLVAAVKDKDGRSYASSPVGVYVSSIDAGTFGYSQMSLPRVLPDGSLMFFYSSGAPITLNDMFIVLYPNVPQRDPIIRTAYLVQGGGGGHGDGIFVDTSLTNGVVSRFYLAFYGQFLQFPP